MIRCEQLPAVVRLARAVPGLRLVLDHLGKPRIAAGELEPWRTELVALAGAPNVTAKLSGLVTEADWSSWSVGQVAPYAEAALGAFGPSRLMFGSDWPVARLATTYPRWLATARALTSGLDADERRAVFGGRPPGSIGSPIGSRFRRLGRLGDPGLGLGIVSANITRRLPAACWVWFPPSIARIEVPMRSDPALEIWFLTGSQSLYGEDTLDQVARQSQEIAATLDASGDISVPIVWKPVLTTAPDIRRACLEATASDSCVGVIAWMHTFSPAKMWIGGLEALRKPLLHFHTQANVSLPWAEIDMDFMNLNQAAHGDREFGYIETRMRVRRKSVVGHASDERSRQRIGTWARAAIGVHAARNLRLARFGDNMRDVAVTEGTRPTRRSCSACR